jgi:hypothetical protein
VKDKTDEECCHQNLKNDIGYKIWGEQKDIVGKVLFLLHQLSTTPWRCMSCGIATPFLTSALGGGEWSASRLSHFIRRERAPCTHRIGGWVDPRTSLDTGVVKNLLPLLRIPGHPVGSPSLHRLNCPGLWKLFLGLITYAPNHEDIWGSGSIAPSFLTSALVGGDWSTSCPCCFTLGKQPWYLLFRRLDGLQNQSRHYGEEITVLSLLGIELQLFGCPACNVAAILAEL